MCFLILTITSVSRKNKPCEFFFAGLEFNSIEEQNSNHLKSCWRKKVDCVECDVVSTAFHLEHSSNWCSLVNNQLAYCNKMATSLPEQRWKAGSNPRLGFEYTTFRLEVQQVPTVQQGDQRSQVINKRDKSGWSWPSLVTICEKTKTKQPSLQNVFTRDLLATRFLRCSSLFARLILHSFRVSAM